MVQHRELVIRWVIPYTVSTETICWTDRQERISVLRVLSLWQPVPRLGQITGTAGEPECECEPYFSQSSFFCHCWQLQVGMWPINLLYRCTGSCFKVFAVWLEAYGLYAAKCQLAGSLRSFPWRMCCPCQQTSSIVFYSLMFKLSVINIKNLPLQQTSLFVTIAQPNPDKRLFGLTYSSAYTAQATRNYSAWVSSFVFLGRLKCEVPHIQQRLGTSEAVHFVKWELCGCSWVGLEVNATQRNTICSESQNGRRNSYWGTVGF